MALEIGKRVVYDGREFVLRGIDPMSVCEGHAEIEDPDTGECLRVPMAALAPGPAPGGVLGETA